MNEVTTTDASDQHEAQTYRPSAAIDPARLDYLWKLAERMARSTTVPKSLRTEKGSDNKEVDLPIETITANVFAVVEQADRWNQSPFALLSAAAIVHGKLGFEGKVIAAVLEANFGIVLNAYYTGEPGTDAYRIFLCDKELPEDIVDQLQPGMRVPGYKIMDGSVKEWKTSGNGSPWRPDTYSKMLIYRGTREWCRIYKPAAIMGVLADDELLAIEADRRAAAARDVTPQKSALEGRFGGSKTDGFNGGNVTKQLQQGADEMVDLKTGELSRVDRNGGQQEGNIQERTQTSQSENRTNTDPRLPASTFQEYSKALLRFGSTENLKKGHDEFWSPNGPPNDDLGRFIYTTHVKRVKNELSMEDTVSQITEEIERSYEI